MSERRVAVVTGANRGLGLEISRRLAERGLRVVLTARDDAKGRAAAAGLAAAGHPVDAHQLDVTDEASVRRFGEFARSSLGRADVLVNNAGVFLDAKRAALEADLGVVRATLETNALGAWRVAQELIPLMRRHGYGRIVNLSSGLGQLTDMEGGYPGYRMSKAALNALTRMLAAELAGAGILVNAVCPGWVRTDMGGPDADRSVEEGAETPIWLSTLPDDGPTGGLFRDKQLIPW
ncbi:MAG TPA: SDR family oxidoreductase [bacterium]